MGTAADARYRIAGGPGRPDGLTNCRYRAMMAFNTALGDIVNPSFLPLTVVLSFYKTARSLVGTGSFLIAFAMIAAFAIAASAVWYIITVMFWNALLVPYLDAVEIASLGGGILFVLGVVLLGKIAGFWLCIWSIGLFLTGGTASVLDMRLDATHMLLWAVFLLVFSASASSKDSGKG
jgi:hypothetical protein